MKQVWQRLLRYLRDWKIPFKDQSWELVDRFIKLLITRLQTTWKSFSSSKSHGGRATEAYLKSHLEEADEIHVIMG
jgi:hypothetical protein